MSVHPGWSHLRLTSHVTRKTRGTWDVRRETIPDRLLPANRCLLFHGMRPATAIVVLVLLLVILIAGAFQLRAILAG